MIQNRRRKAFNVGAPSWRYPQGALPKNVNKPTSGGRVGGRNPKREKSGQELLTEAERIRKHRDRMKNKNPRVFKDAPTRGVPWNHTNTYKDLSDRVDPDQAYTQNNVTIGFVSAPDSDTSGKAHTYSEETKKAKKRNVFVVDGVQPTIVHRKQVTTGRPTTRAVWNVVKSNGITRLVLFDTKFPASANIHDLTPDQKDHASGFNQRCFTVLSPSTYVNHQDLLTISGIVPASTTEPAKSQRAYLSILDTTTELQLHNQNANHSTMVKVHLVKSLKEGDLPLETIQDNISEQVFNASTTVADPCAVPLWQQFSTPQKLSSADEAKVARSTSVSALMSVKGRGLLDSSHFRDHFEIVRTTGIKLMPGDILNYRHTHCYGPGFDTATLCDAVTVHRLNQPASYFYIIEQYGGDTVELTFCYAVGKYTSYLGKNPTFLAMEVRKSIRYAMAEATGEDFNINGVDTRPVHMRVWDSDSNVTAGPTEKEFNLSNSLITSAATPPFGQGNITTRTNMAQSNLTHGTRLNI